MQQKGIASILLLGLLIGLGFIVFGIFIIYPRFQSYQTIKFFYEPRVKSSLLDRHITPREITPVKPIGENVSFKDINFISSWGALIRSTQQNKVLDFEFPENTNILVSYEDSKNLVDQSILDSNSETMLEVYKSSRPLSYELQDLILKTQPNEIGFFTSPYKAKRIAKILTFKMFDDLYITKGNIYSFSTNTVRGFQSGDPGKDKVIFIRIYNNQNNFIGITINSLNIRQDDIDTLINSVHILTN